MNEKFSFLKSVRFWKLVIAATVIILKSKGVIIEDTLVDIVSEIVAIVCVGSVAVATVDRRGDKVVEAAQISKL